MTFYFLESRFVCVCVLFSLIFFFIFFFFFSSRRRHTRSLCDWSSDVCSSDLGASRTDPDKLRGRTRHNKTVNFSGVAQPGRSEERRVGKECRSRWWPDH